MTDTHVARAACIAHHVRMALHKSALTDRAYGQSVADLYTERTPLHARTLEFHCSQDPYADEKANAQIVRRIIEGTVRMPVDLEEALVLALPEPFRGACLSDLAARFGLLAATPPSCNPKHQAADLGAMAKSAGDALVALAPMFQDGRIDAADEPFERNALRAIREAQATLVTMEATVRVCTGHTNKVLAK